MWKYYGNKGRFISDIRVAMPISFSNYLELCCGLATVARVLVPGHIPRTVVDKDIGLTAMLQIARDNPTEFVQAMNRIPYSRDSYELAEDIRDSGYSCSTVTAAVAKKILTEMSYNAACNSYRDVERHVDDASEPEQFRYYMQANQYYERYYRQISPDIFRMSQELQGIKIITDDFRNWLCKLDDPDQFVFIDPPYRPSVRQAKKIGYDQELDEDAHLEFVQFVTKLYTEKKLRSKVMIFGYVQEDLKRDMYCNYLVRFCDFKLIFLKEIYLPKIVRGDMNKKKTKKYECIFINYDDTMEQEFVPSERIFTRKDIYGRK